jgi:hypothetical protein
MKWRPGPQAPNRDRDVQYPADMEGSGQAKGRDSGRVTPYDVVFGADSFDESRFELLREQADAHRATSPTELFMLPAAGELLRELLPDDDGHASHRAVVDRVSALMFHGFRFWLHGRRLVTMTEPALRALLGRAQPIGTWSFTAPAPAGYLQLPRNIVWARIAESAPAEPVDGFFWSWPGAGEGARGARLDLLVCLGVRRGRPGVSLVDAAVETADVLQHWADADARPGSPDFANILPGGELQHYYSLVTQAEVLKLASLCFWHVQRRGKDDAAGGPVAEHG